MVIRLLIVWLVVVGGASSTLAEEYGFTQSFEDRMLRRISIPSGHVEPIPGDDVGDYIASYAMTADGMVYGLGDNSARLYAFDSITGASSFVGEIQVGPDQYPTGLAVDKNDRLLLLANSNPNAALYEIDPLDASATFVMWIHSNEVGRFAIFGNTCYARKAPYATDLLSIDLQTGDVTELPIQASATVHDLSFSNTGQLYALEAVYDYMWGCQIKQLVTFDLSTGEETVVAQLPYDNGDCYVALAIQQEGASSVPAHGRFGSTVLVLTIAVLGVLLISVRMGLSR